MYSLKTDFEANFDQSCANVPVFSIPPALRATVQLYKSGLVSQLRSTEEKYYKKCLDKLRECDSVSLDWQNYRQILRLGLSIEAIECKTELESATRDVDVIRVGGDPKSIHYQIWYKHCLKISPVQPGDFVEIHLANSPTAYRMRVLSVLKDHLLVQVPVSNKFNVICTNYGIRAVIKFIHNSYTYDCGFYALQQTSDVTIQEKLFPSELKSEEPKDEIRLAINNIKWNNSSIQSNDEQKTAIYSIINKTSHPAPFILFGPPGTGKTTTLVEAILQILINDSHSKILICTPSNSAADTISKKLMAESSCSEKLLVRLLSERAKSKTMKLDGENDSFDINPASKQNTHCFDEKEEIESLISDKRVIICTLNYCARLVYHGFKNFSYIFIDEAGQATEIDALIPFGINEDAHIILSGDHLQLGPVVKSRLAQPILGISMMERLMNCELYRKNSITERYNSCYVVQLLNNYRSHPSIIGLADRLFYDNQLKCFGPTDSQIEALQFFNCTGEEQKSHNSYSPYNEVEIAEVIVGVQEVLSLRLKPTGAPVTQEDIGVITPFRAQQERIQGCLRKANMGGVEVGTVESFQGREKDVIIISTVRSKVFTRGNESHLGSLSHPKRLNVAITRAKRLLIIVGDGEVLKHSDHWRFVLMTCQRRGAVLGKEFSNVESPVCDKIDDHKKIIDCQSLLYHEQQYISEDLTTFFNLLNLDEINFVPREPLFLESIYAPTGALPCDEVVSLNEDNSGMELHKNEIHSFSDNYQDSVDYFYDNEDPLSEHEL